MKILAIESSCDETSVAIVENGKKVLSNIVYSQIKTHKEYGGVVPEIASREHVEVIIQTIDEALNKATLKLENIDAIAVTEGPGLIGSLLVGINAAKALSLSNNIPLIGLNHLKGHIYANNIDNDMEFPALACVLSGGHTSLVYMKNHFEFKVIGETQDDAIGEAYDKVARVIGLSYPGGPNLDKLAQIGQDTYNLPRVMINSKDYNFSFSGIKSAVINLNHKLNQKKQDVIKEDLAASFQQSVIDVVMKKLKDAINEYKVNNIFFAGGVSANSELRKRIKNMVNDGYNILIPKIEYCTDNAAMIGIAAYFKYKKENQYSKLNINGYSTKGINN